MTSPLNDRIAREVGWTQHEPELGQINRGTHWHEPGELQSGFECFFAEPDPPDFENSVDAHEAWTVPKAKEMGFLFSLVHHPADHEGDWYASFSSHESPPYRAEGRGDTMAGAICEAWGKLMKEVEGD